VLNYPRPSLVNGWAHTKSEAAFPGFWDGLRFAFAPEMGCQGDRMFRLDRPSVTGELATVATAGPGTWAWLNLDTYVSAGPTIVENEVSLSDHMSFVCKTHFPSVFGSRQYLGSVLAVGGAYIGFLASPATPELRVRVTGGGYATLGGITKDGGYHTFVVTKDHETINAFEDGVQTDTAISILPPTTPTLTVDRVDLTGNGYSAASLYDRQLTTSEALALSLDPLLPFYPNPNRRGGWMGVSSIEELLALIGLFSQTLAAAVLASTTFVHTLTGGSSAGTVGMPFEDL
jgi:hypothetical protein